MLSPYKIIIRPLRTQGERMETSVVKRERESDCDSVKCSLAFDEMECKRTKLGFITLEGVFVDASEVFPGKYHDDQSEKDVVSDVQIYHRRVLAAQTFHLHLDQVPTTKEELTDESYIHFLRKRKFYLRLLRLKGANVPVGVSLESMVSACKYYYHISMEVSEPDVRAFLGGV